MMFFMISCTFWRSRIFFFELQQNYLVALIRFEYILPLTSCWEFSTSYVHCTDIWPLFLWPLTSQGKLEASFEEIESMLNMLEDTCEEEELIKNKKTQIAELAKYRHQKEWDPYQTVSVPKNIFRYEIGTIQYSVAPIFREKVKEKAN